MAVSGSIGFIGLVVPHLVRGFVGSDHRRVLPIAALVGSLFLIWVDVIARSAFDPIELPVGVITALLGDRFLCGCSGDSRGKEKWMGIQFCR